MKKTPGDSKKYLLVITVTLLALGGAIFIANQPQLAQGGVISQATIKSSANANVVTAMLPYVKSGAVGEILDYTFTIRRTQGGPAVFRIVPDDCVELLEINGKPITLESAALAARCNWRTGFKIDLRGYLHEGSNEVHMKIRNAGGPQGLKIVPDAP